MTIRNKIYALLLCVVLSPSVKAQRTISDLETNADHSMGMRDDSTSSQKAKVVPADVRAWVVDETYGNITPIHVDTLLSLHMNDNLAEGRTGHYNSLSNLGTPRLSRVFSDRTTPSRFFFTDPYDQFFVTTDRFRHYNTKSPYMNISYNCCGSKQTGDDHVKCIYTNNAGKRMNFGGIYDYMYGQGFYDNQSTSFMNASAWASYLGDKYNFHFYYQHNFMKMAESGGITDMTYITNPEMTKTGYTSNDIPVYLYDTWSRQEHDVAFLNHHYNIGFYRKEAVDSVTEIEVFVPVIKFFHTFKLQKMMRNLKGYQETKMYHTNTYLPGDSINDRTKYFSVRNLGGVAICEGFNKWAACGLNAYIGHEYRRFNMADTLSNVPNTYMYDRRYTEYDIFIGGQLIRQQGTILHYNVNAEYNIAGANSYDFTLSGHGECNIPVRMDTAQVTIDAHIKSLTPSFYFSNYHSKHAWWDNNLDRETSMHVGGTISFPKTMTMIKAGFDNISNYTYFSNNGIVEKEEVRNQQGTVTQNRVVSNNVCVNQSSSAIQVFGITLEQNFKLGILHFDNEATYQWTSDQKALPLPALSLYNNLYIDFHIAKVLHTQIGADMKYFTSYYAPDYSPVIGMFTTQNQDNLVKIGNYPLISLYANFALKRSRFYVQYYHANQGTGRYLWAPGYPMNPTTIRFGISWNFYD